MTATTAGSIEIRQRIGIGRSLLAGLAGGVTGGILASIAAPIVMAITGIQAGELLNPFSIMLASTVQVTIGFGLLSWLINRFTANQWVFPVVTFVLVTLYSILVAFFGSAMTPPGITVPADFPIVANVLHYIVWLAAVIVMPLVARRGS